ncbi:phosphoglycerate mutase [Novilysobacter erysipheiresistens]
MLLLPPRARFGGQRLSSSTAQWLGRADRDDVTGDPLARAFDILPRGWPVAAVTRQRDTGDAAGSAWLRADPVFIQPDINGARLLAHGDALSLTARDAAALLPALKPLFGDAGFPIDAPVPSRWYLRLPEGARLPAMADPGHALGADLFDHLPEGDDGRRWRTLLSEAQIVLHNHPHNAERVAAGLAPINSLWFWGAGRMPDHVRSGFNEVVSDDDALQAFGAVAGARSTSLPNRWSSAEGSRLVDLRHGRDLTALDRDWLAPLLADLQARRLDSATLEFADGHRLRLRRNQRWRFWRRPLRSFVASTPAAPPA